MGELHICAPRGYYLGQIRGVGCRRWRTVTGKCCIRNRAFAAAARKMGSYDKRVRVLWCTYEGWYEPNIVMEGKRT